MTIGSLMVDAAGKIASPSFSNVSPLSRSRMTYPEAPRNSEVSRASVDSSFIRISARFGSAGGHNGAATLRAGQADDHQERACESHGAALRQRLRGRSPERGPREDHRPPSPPRPG